ncbi:hypothetical protein ACO0QE_004287 [Hanseniaspora vineae]
MLFKQWNEQAEPRHILDDQFKETPSLVQVKTLPKFESVETYFEEEHEKKSSLFIIPKRMHVLFVAYHAKPLHEFVCTYGLVTYKFPVYSHDSVRMSKNCKETTQKTSVLIVDETFPPIVLNFFSNELSQYVNDNSTVVLGLSDRISSVKVIEPVKPPLEGKSFVPPEFVSNFGASLFHKAVQANYWFLPSEGPVGFEKVSQTNIGQLLQLIEDRFDISDPSFGKRFAQNWNENDGTHVNTLYL